MTSAIGAGFVASPFTAIAPRTSSRSVDVSVLVPAKDEAENLPLFMELAAVAFAAAPDR
jgi:hypothetical protein